MQLHPDAIEKGIKTFTEKQERHNNFFPCFKRGEKLAWELNSRQIVISLELFLTQCIIGAF